MFRRMERNRGMRMLRAVVIALAVLASTVVGAPPPAGAMTSAGAMTEEGVFDAVAFEDVAAIPTLTDVHARVFRLYWAFFDRQPDAEGALFWADQSNRCWSLERIANFFATSDEFVTTYGTLTDAQFVDLVYRNVLDRAAEPAGRTFWENAIASGSRTRVQVMLDFAYADEFVANHPLPSDGRADQPCSTSASDLRVPAETNAVTLASLDTATIPSDACFFDMDPGNTTLVDGRTGLNADGTWVELATGTDRIAALRLRNIERRAFADISGDGNVDAVVGLHCRTPSGDFDHIVPVLYVHGEEPVALPYTAGADLSSGEEPVGLRAVLARQDRIVFSWAATFTFSFPDLSDWDDDPCCPSIEFMSEAVAGPTPGVTQLDKYSPWIAGERLLASLIEGEPFTIESDASAEVDAAFRPWFPAGSSYSDYQCRLLEVNVIRCGVLASTGPAFQFDLGIDVFGRWFATNPMGFI